MFRSLTLIVLVCSTCAFGAREPEFQLGPIDPTPGPMVSVAAAYSAGFEPGEGYALGPIEPQLGWSASGTNLPFASVSNTNPFAGQNQLRMIKDPTQLAGVDRIVTSPSLGAQPADAQINSVLVAISNYGGANYVVAGQTSTLLTWEVLFQFEGATPGSDGTILVVDDLGSGLVFVDTGAVWAEGPYRELRVETDPALNSMKYFYNNALIYTGVGGMFGGQVTEQLVFLHDNFQLAGETADFDNAGIANVPEPGMAGVILIGLCGLLRRR